MVFTDTALLLDLGSPPQRPGSTFKATDINYLASIFAAYGKQTAPACTSGGCFAARTSSLPQAPSIPWGGYPPASLLLPFGGNQQLAKCWSLQTFASQVKIKAIFKSKYRLSRTTFEMSGWVCCPLPAPWWAVSTPGAEHLAPEGPPSWSHNCPMLPRCSRTPSQHTALTAQLTHSGRDGTEYILSCLKGRGTDTGLQAVPGKDPQIADPDARLWPLAATSVWGFAQLSHGTG